MRFLCNQLSFVSDIPAVDGNIVNLYLHCRYAILLYMYYPVISSSSQKTKLI
jgi:hypothetical protein